MDISVKTDGVAFNYRVAAIIVNDGRLLVMQDEGIPHDYLPGGRVHLGEPAETALLRELREELNVALSPTRLVFIAESFFTLMGVRCHEMALYYLTEASSELLAHGDAFTRTEGHEVHHFRWVPFAELEQLSFYPIFLKERINSLPAGIEYISCSDGHTEAIHHS